MNAQFNKAQKIKLIVLDIDNILTDGKIIWSSDASETKNFSVLDGFGIKRAQSYGIKMGTISSRISTVSEIRIKELKFDMLSIGEENKLKSLEKFKIDLKIEFEEIAYMGDDLLDLPAIRKCGLSATVPNAVFEVKREVDYVTELSAGNGAVREFIDIILKAKDIIKLPTEKASQGK